MTTRNEIVARIISEEVSGLSDDTFKNSEAIKGTLSVKRKGDELELPEVVDAEEVDADAFATALVAPQEWVPGDDELLMKLESLSSLLVRRLGPAYRSHMCQGAHKAKMRIKSLRESQDIEFSDLRRAVVSEYIDVISAHIQSLSDCEKQIVENLHEIAPFDVNAKAHKIIANLASNLAEMRAELVSEGEEVVVNFDETMIIPLISYLEQCERDTKFEL